MERMDVVITSVVEKDSAMVRPPHTASTQHTTLLPPRHWVYYIARLLSSFPDTTPRFLSVTASSLPYHDAGQTVRERSPVPPWAAGAAAAGRRTWSVVTHQLGVML